MLKQAQLALSRRRDDLAAAEKELGRRQADLAEVKKEYRRSPGRRSSQFHGAVMGFGTNHAPGLTSHGGGGAKHTIADFSNQDEKPRAYSLCLLIAVPGSEEAADCRSCMGESPPFPLPTAQCLHRRSCALRSPSRSGSMPGTQMTARP